MPIYQDNRQFLLRFRGIGICFLIILLIYLGKLWQMTVLQEEYYRNQADRNHIRILPVPAPRGLIYDREGRVLVDNVQGSNLVLFRDRADDLARTKNFLCSLGVDPDVLAQRIRASRNYGPYQSVVIKENLSMADMAYVMSHQSEYPGLAIIEEPRRIYRFGELAAHVLGYVGEISDQQLHTEEFENSRPGDLVGKYGLERIYNRLLTGRDGERRVQVNSIGKDLEQLDLIDPHEGKALTLTLDLDLQRVAEAELGDDPGAVVAFNPQSGEILALASRPAFDPNDFAMRISRRQWEDLIKNPDHPLQNRAIQSTFSPGSVFKVVMALAGLESGVIDENTTVYCNGGINLYGHYFRCWKHGGHGVVNLTEAIRESCNVYFYLLGQKLGIERIADFSHSVGLGRLSGIDLFGEVSGLVPSAEWKEARYGQRWYAGETISVAIGQGPMTVTPVQLARAIGIIATGKAPQMHLLKDQGLVRSPVHDPFSVPGFTLANMQAVRKGMWKVVNEWGTGHAAKVTGFEVCGKTGTAQTISNVGRASLSKDELEKYEPNAWFAGFAPRDNPEIVVAVIVQRGGSGGGTAAPIAGKVFQTYFDKHKQEFSQPIQFAGRTETEIQSIVTQ